MLYAKDVRDKMKDWIADDIWDIQLDDIIEFYSACMPVNTDYKTARKMLT